MFPDSTERYDSDKEIEIIHELAQRILLYEPMLNVASDICGELDWCVYCVGLVVAILH